MMAAVIIAEWSRNVHSSMCYIPEIRLSVFNCTYIYILSIKVTVNEPVQVSLHICASKELLTERLFFQWHAANFQHLFRGQGMKDRMAHFASSFHITMIPRVP